MGYDEPELIACVRKGIRNALKQIFDQYREKVYGSPTAL